MSESLRGADIVMRTLQRAGHNTIFTLSGNHIMSLFDAAIETKPDLVHVRHEAAAVHMADAWGHLTGTPGVAMVTGGPGHANTLGALFMARAQESPLVLLSGHCAAWELGRGGFQEMRQAEMAAPVAKASWSAGATETLGVEVAKAFRIAVSGRPGPVHLSLPSDVLDHRVDGDSVIWPAASEFSAAPIGLSDAAADVVHALIASAKRPLVLAGPQLATRDGHALLARIEAATNVPTCVMESARGMADATIGAFSQAMRRADLIVLLGKAFDYTLNFGGAPAIDAACRWVVIDSEAALVDRAAEAKGALLAFGCIADARPAGLALIRRASGQREPSWLNEVRALMNDRPASWATLAVQTPGKLHPAEVFRTLKPYVERDPNTVLICDGGEFAQWGQSMVRTPRRLINGVSGLIGSSLPYAGASCFIEPKAPVFAVLGDGTFGFHMAEFETAVRRKLPFVALVGNDARWNAEHNLQVREYGAERAHGCELQHTRYDLAAAALGAHGEFVDRVADLPAAIERALASGKPACINIMIESVPGPTLGATAVKPVPPSTSGS